MLLRILREDRRYLLGLLNSKLLSFLFRGRFRAKQLSGGFLAINKSQLDQLPIRIVQAEDLAEMQIRQLLVRCVERLERLTNERLARRRRRKRCGSASAHWSSKSMNVCTACTG